MAESTSSVRHWATDELLNDDNTKKSIINMLNFNVKRRKIVLDSLHKQDGSFNAVNVYKTRDHDYDKAEGFELPAIDSRYAVYESKTYTRQVQKWIGYVKCIQTESFIAELKDLTAGGTSEEAEFFFVQVSPEDMPLLVVGAVFYWHVGFYIQNGQAKNDGFIRFQRVINWTEDEYDKALKKADYWYSNLVGE